MEDLLNTRKQVYDKIVCENLYLNAKLSKHGQHFDLES